MKHFVITISTNDNNKMHNYNSNQVKTMTTVLCENCCTTNKSHLDFFKNIYS